MHQVPSIVENVNKNCCCFAIRKTMRAITLLYDAILADSGIRSTQFNLLIEISAAEGKTLTEIAENMIMDRTTLTRNLKPLEKSLLIQSVATKDKRAKAYMLTDKGRDVVQKCLPLWENAQNIMLSCISAEDYSHLLVNWKIMINKSNEARVKFLLEHKNKI